MKPVRCLLVDDEDLALDVLEMYASRIPQLNVVGRCADVQEAVAFMQKDPVELVFLDIQMPGLTGMEWAARLIGQTKVIFCTAYDEFALQGYEVNAVDYLLKPFSFERFEKAVEKALVLIESAKKSVGMEEETLCLTIKSDGKLFRIKQKDILYFHSLSNYYKVVTVEKKLIAYGSLSALESELPTEDFIRIHRSYLVAIDKIQAYSGSEVVINGEKLAVGRAYRASLDKLPQKNPQKKGRFFRG
ncbi:LytTR family DNA-binding domain-containing protein [Paludibacter sp.]|uniref:LytR/AlgR family response regulator transcription factor n=1 Tax=Paludibacter sp. TaxID=1898105 RepID=UPI001354ED35|nr:LytTR family DNA-binding domain-containing protein [Paludibacter sp.]MTK52276.1 response regulator transcription factor [Paludibacter sp.]